MVTTYLVSQRAEIPQKDDSFQNPRGIMSKLLTNNQVGTDQISLEITAKNTAVI